MNLYIPTCIHLVGALYIYQNNQFKNWLLVFLVLFALGNSVFKFGFWESGVVSGLVIFVVLYYPEYIILVSCITLPATLIGFLIDYLILDYQRNNKIITDHAL
jgi:hypothetical protein